MAYVSTKYVAHVRLGREGAFAATVRTRVRVTRDRNGREVRPFVPTLVLALRNRDDAVRRAAAEALGDLGAEARTAVTALRQARNDHAAGVRQQALLALQKIRLAVRLGESRAH